MSSSASSPSTEPSSFLFVFRRLFSLSWPIIGLNVLGVLALAVDTIMCGKLPNNEVILAGLGYAVQVAFLLMVAMFGITVGSVAMIARAFGAKEHERVNHIFHQSVMLTILFGIFVAVIGNLLAGPILTAMGASEAAKVEGLRYLRPFLSGAVFVYLVVLFGAILRGVGNTRVAFLISLVMNALNVLFNYALILGHWGFPALGLRGAAMGTICAQLVAFLLFVWWIRRGSVSPLSLSLKPAPLDGKLAHILGRVGTPAALDMVLLNASFLSIITMLSQLDEVAVAAHGIGLRIQALAFVPGMSISQATAALVGQALGKGSAEDAKRIVRVSMVFCFVVMTSLGVLILLCAFPIVEIFEVGRGSSLENFSVMWIRLLGYGMPPVGIYIAIVGMFRGAGDTKTGLYINFYTTLLFQIPLSYLLGFPLGLGVYGVWLAFPLSFFLKLAVGWLVFRRGTWAKVGAHV